MKSAADRALAGGLADLAAAIERAAGDLGLGEEPAGFQAALEAGAPAPDPLGGTGPEPRRD
jgi:hypothetical protein